MAIYTRSSKCCPIRAEEGITGVLCPPGSNASFRDLLPSQQIGGYPRPGQLSSVIDEPTLDSEGRCVVLEFPAFVLIGVYSPATRDETRTEFREGFIDALDVRVRNLVAMGKQVFLCGDLNIIRSELDTAGLAERLRKEEMTLEDFFSAPSRRFFNQIVFGGRVIGERDEGREQPVLWDICREFHPSRPGMYTCWETRKNARPGNFGSRIDYVLCSSGIKGWFIDSNIQEGLLGSDHCPVYATLVDQVSLEGAQVHVVDVMNPPGMFKDGKRLREWSAKDLLPTSAKLIPEFDRRRNIRDMFFKKPAAPPSTKSSASNADKQESPAQVDSASLSTDLDISSQSQSSSLAEPKPPVNAAIKSTNPAVLAQKNAMPKRQAEATASTSRPQKKNKAALSRESSAKSGPGLAQSSLRGFFKPRTPDIDANNKETDGAAEETDPTGGSTPQRKKDAGTTPLASDVEGRFPGDNGAETARDPSGGRVFDPIESKASWSKLLGKRVVPRCEHGEDCQTMVTKKAGINCGECVFFCTLTFLFSIRHD